MSYLGHSLGVLALCRDAVDVFYNLSQRSHSWEVSLLSRGVDGVFNSTHCPTGQGTLTVRTMLGQISLCNNDNEGVLFPKLPDWSLIIRKSGVISRSLVGGILLLCRDAVGVFWSKFNRMGCINGDEISYLTKLCKKERKKERKKGVKLKRKFTL